MTQEKDRQPTGKRKLIEGQLVLLEGFEPTTLSLHQGEAVIVPKEFFSAGKVEVQIAR